MREGQKANTDVCCIAYIGETTNQVRIELRRDRHNHFPEGGQVGGVTDASFAAAGVPGDVGVEAGAAADADPVRVGVVAAGEEGALVVPVQRNVEDGWIVFEYVLGPFLILTYLC